MATTRAAINPAIWIGVLSVITTLALAALGAVWYGGGLDKTISAQQTLAAQIQSDLRDLHIADQLNRQELKKAVDERNHLMNEMERRLTDKSDAVNEKISSATATNTATRDMLMMLERRLEVLEAERRNVK